MSGTDWLKSDDYVPFAPDGLGETIHIHHCKTGNGNDRLYITRKDNGDIIAYCHHCGSRGYHSVVTKRKVQSRTKSNRYTRVRNGHGKDSREHGRNSDSSGTRSEETRDVGGLYSSGNATFREWGNDAKRWWLEYGLTVEQAREYGVLYNSESNCLHLPIYNSNIVVGLQQRFFNDTSRKYITTGSTVSDPITVSGVDKLVIVEDLRSALKVSNIQNSLPLFGTKLADEQVTFIRRCHYSKVLIFLDNDNDNVRRAAQSIKKRLSPWVDCAIIRKVADPKELSLHELEDLIYGS